MGTTRAFICAGLVLGATLVEAACPPEGSTRASLLALKARQWAMPDDHARERLADGLLACLADPDPSLRDVLAFEPLQHWMRAGLVPPERLQRMRERLLGWLAPDPADTAGFRQPFAALALAEVARVDRRQPFLSPLQLDDLLMRGAAYLAGVRDYRGFDAREGWRHGVAHGADLLLQLSLNPRLDDAQRLRIVHAVWSQVEPAADHFYQYGEPERLMAPVFHVARRGAIDAAQWASWFKALAAPLAASPAAPTDAALARRHNVGAFLQALYVSMQESGDAGLRERVLPGLSKALKMLP